MVGSGATFSGTRRKRRGDMIIRSVGVLRGLCGEVTNSVEKVCRHVARGVEHAGVCSEEGGDGIAVASSQ